MYSFPSLFIPHPAPSLKTPINHQSSYSGSKVSESKEFTRIIDLDGTSTCLDLRLADALDRLDNNTRQLVTTVKGSYRLYSLALYL